MKLIREKMVNEKWWQISKTTKQDNGDDSIIEDNYRYDDDDGLFKVSKRVQIFSAWDRN